MFKQRTLSLLPVLLFTMILAGSCSKSSSPATPTSPAGVYHLSYGDSVLYLRNQSGDYIVYPTEQRTGTYTGFPEGIEIDDRTGAINVSKSETGLRYRITYSSAPGETTTTTVVLSGISYSDKFYHLSAGDSMALPVYNASPAAALPLTGSVFDEGNGANSGGCSVRTDNGRINLAQTVRNGAFGATPANDSRRDFDIVYRLNDRSNLSSDKLKVRIYYYATMADVAPDLLQTLSDREQDGVFIAGRMFDPGIITHTSKPRPPCIIVIAN